MKFVWLHFYPVLYLSVNDRLSVSTSQHTQRTMELLLNVRQPGTQSHWTAVREVVPQFCSKAVQPTFWHSALEMTTEIQNSLYTQVHCPPFSWPFSPSVSGLLYGLWLCDSLYIHFKACHVDAPAFLFVECCTKKMQWFEWQNASRLWGQVWWGSSISDMVDHLLFAWFQVQYVDYGLVENIPVVHVYPKLLFEDVPQLCMPCQLHGLNPVRVCVCLSTSAFQSSEIGTESLKWYLIFFLIWI